MKHLPTGRHLGGTPVIKTNPNKTMFVRMHRGGLEEAMKTQRLIEPTDEALREYLISQSPNLPFTDEELNSVHVVLYMDRKDDRIVGWDQTYVVRMQCGQTGNIMVVAMANQPLNPTELVHE